MNNIDQLGWDRYFLYIAEAVSVKSKDPSTKVGAVIVDAQNRIIATGFNGFPHRMADHKADYDCRATKYKKTVHAEMSAILSCERPLGGCTLYTWPMPPCEACAILICQTNISRVVAPPPEGGVESRWGSSVITAAEYMCKCGIKCEVIL